MFDMQSMMNFVRMEYENSARTERLISEKKPYKRPYKDYTSTMFKYMLTLNQTEQNQARSKEQTKGEDTVDVRFNKITAPRHCSLKQVDELKPIVLEEMYVNKVHNGRYLLCRIIAKPFYLTGISMIVEDTNGEIENVTVYDYTTSYDIEPSDVFPIGSTIIIKEPFMKTMISDHDNYYIRVESPSDIVFTSDEKWQQNNCIDSSRFDYQLSYDQLNEFGNRCFGRKEFREAIRYYNKALESNKTAAKTFANRAASHLELEMFNEAYLDAKESARLEPTVKAFYRMGRALYSMRQFEAAKEKFQEAVALDAEKNLQLINEIERCERRINEAKTGKYDIKSLIEQVKSGKRRLDVADYVSGDIEVGQVNKKSKGVFALRDIPRGTLLVGSKAASIAFESEHKVRVMTTNYCTKRMDDFTQSQNMKNLFYKLHHDPYLAKEVYKLYAGPNMDRNPSIPDSIVDSIRAELILKYNSFSSQDYPLTHKESQNDPINSSSRMQKMLEKDNSGLWMFPSYFNHSCVANTLRLFLNDFMLMYALKDIKKGEELTTVYCGMNEYDKRAEVCSHFGFKCECRLCTLNQSDRRYTERKRLLEQYNSIKIKIMTNSTNEKNIQRYYKLVKNTYLDGRDESLQRDLEMPLLALFTYYTVHSKFKKAAETLLNTFELLKETDFVSASLAVFHAAQEYRKALMFDESRNALKLAKKHFIGPIEYYNYQFDFDFNSIND